MRADMVEEAWRVVQPVLDAWAKNRTDFPNYPSGSDGPAAADELIARDGGRRWRRSPRNGKRDNELPMIRLVITDVDGTLVTQEKVLTGAGQGGGARAERSGRHARHHQRPAAARHADADRAAAAHGSIAGFNGGVYVRPDLELRSSSLIASRRDVAREALRLILAGGLDAWVYSRNDWYVATPTRRMWRARRARSASTPRSLDASRMSYLAQRSRSWASRTIMRLSPQRDEGAVGARRARERLALAALLSRRHASARQQGRGRRGRFRSCHRSRPKRSRPSAMAPMTC